MTESAVNLGDGLRKLRGRVGLRRLADLQRDTKLVISKSTLSRYERGELLPPIAYASHLDALYDGNGWVELTVRSLWRAAWDPWSDDEGLPSGINAGSWPAQYQGPVWVKLKPTPADVGRQVTITLKWGPWSRLVETELPPKGVLLLTGKATDTDGVARTCNVTSNIRVFALFGAGDDLENENLIDIREGWRML